MFISVRFVLTSNYYRIYNFYKKKYSDSIKYYLNELSKYYDVRTCVFGREVKSDTIFTFSDNYSNFENLYDFVSNKYHGTNITDLIIASDGIVNRGQDLSYLSLQPSISVNTVLLGDTNDYDDMMIKSINNNKYALLENNFPIEASIYSNKNFGLFLLALLNVKHKYFH